MAIYSLWNEDSGYFCVFKPTVTETTSFKDFLSGKTVFHLEDSGPNLDSTKTFFCDNLTPCGDP
jgi:hypothetical protein